MVPGLFPRHGSSAHFANIHSGYYLLVTCILFALIVVFIRRFLSNRFKQNIIRAIYGLSPLFLVCYFASSITLILALVFITQHQEHYYNVFTKRLGRISYAFTNLIILMVLQDPLSIFKGTFSYLEFIPLHKWLSRSIFGLSILHGILFIIKWSRDPNVSVWAKMLKNKANLIGVILSLEILSMLIISLKPIRQKSYKLFYITHQLVNLSFIILIPFHARPGVSFPFLVINLCLLVAYCLNRTIRCQRLNVQGISQSIDSRLYIVELPAENFYLSSDNWSLGSHIRISPYARYDPRYWLFPSHPYTVATQNKSSIKLIINKTNFFMEYTKKYTINGPYQNCFVSQVMQDKGKKVNNIILVAGGSGISFILPIYQFLLSTDNPHSSKISYNSLKIVWLVKNIGEFIHIKRNLGISSEYFEQMDIFITAEIDPLENVKAKNNINTATSNNNNNEEDIELQDFVPMIDKMDNSIDGEGESNNNNKRIRYGRINWEVDLQDICIPSEEENTTINANGNYIIGCGPEGLIHDCEKFGTRNNYEVITEYYSL